jgi:hypothetical protein
MRYLGSAEKYIELYITTSALVEIEEVIFI